MSAEPQATDQSHPSQPESAADAEQLADNHANEEQAEAEEADDEEEEAKLKYAKLTGSLTNVYRNGDSTSAFTVAGDKMVLGTHNGNIHVLSLPTLQSLRTYHAHSASITCLSVSPTPPPPSVLRPAKESSGNSALRSPPSSIQTASTPAKSDSSPRPQRGQQPNISNTPNNAIYVATSSLDGHVCISSLLEPKDVQLRNFARPVQAVCLSPDYKSDRTYLSGGLAGQLVLTVGGKTGVTVDANTNSAAAAASGFLGAFGLSADRGKDTVLHDGEGAISCIKWSLSGKWVVWINEMGIRIMRSHLKLGSENQDDAWKRIAHDKRPNLRGWEEMAGFWKGRAEWVDERKLEADDDHVQTDGQTNGVDSTLERRRQSKKGAVEKLVVGWGNTACILHITEGPNTASSGGERVIGSVQKPFRIRFDDCIVSGLSLFTPNFYAILAYRTHDDDNKPIQQPHSTESNGNSTQTKKRRGRHNRQSALAPQLRLVNMHTGDVDAIDDLSISRFESLSAPDYHLASLFIPVPSEREQTAPERWALEGIWEGTRNATRIFSSAASVRSSHSSEGRSFGKVGSPGSSAVGVPLPLPAGRRIGITDAHPFAASPGLKLFIQSPYDCILAVKTDLKDRLQFLLEQRRYQQVWDLIDRHPELADTMSEKDSAERGSVDAPPSPSSSRPPGDSLADFLADDTTSHRSGRSGIDSAARREKFRIGELWLQQLVTTGQWKEAGKIAGKVLATSKRWEHWVLTFDHAGKFDEITPYIPTNANLPGLVYEVVLGHYIAADLPRFQELLEMWKPEKELYDVGSVRAAVESRLDSDDIEEGSEDWKILIEALAELYLAGDRVREALRCYIRVQNAEKAMDLMRGEGLLDVVAPEDVPGLLMLRVSKDQMRSAPLNELEEASSEVVKLLVEQALKGSLLPATVIDVLERRGRSYLPFLFFYLRALWNSADERGNEQRGLRRKYDHRNKEGQALVEDHADLAIELFAEYDRDLLLTFLEHSEVYNYEKAAGICEQRNYIPELVYVLSRTGQTERALRLIIEELGDVEKAVKLAKENPDLWDDLLDYSMSRPTFIRGLLEEVGMAIDPIQLVRRIPEGLEIEGLKDGIAKMLRDHEIQQSLSEGVAKVLRGEVSAGMDTLRAGQKKAVRFEVVHDAPPLSRGESTVAQSSIKPEGEAKDEDAQEVKQVKPGHCVGCGEAFQEDEDETLIGFACGHVYHLSCLLKCNPATSDPESIRRVLRQLGSGASTDEGYTGRSVGAKVAHAHIIKNALQGGCWQCAGSKGN